MTLNVGVIGVGMIGREHIHRLANKLVGAKVVALADVDAQHAETAAADLPGAKVYATGEALIAEPEVQAVVVTSWGPTHDAYVLAAIKAGKPIAVQLVREHYIKQHMADPAGTEVVLNALPSINAGGVVVEQMVSQDGSDPLTKTEMTICKQMGLDPKKFAENKKRQRGASDGSEA